MHISTVVQATKCIKVLCAYGEKINTGDGKEGNSPLHMTVKSKNLDMAKFLIEEVNYFFLNLEKMGCFKLV